MTTDAADPWAPSSHEDTVIPTVHKAWSAVMGEATSLGKDSRNAQQGFNFRGVDAVMNLLGPILRKHGVSVIPSVVEHRASDFTTKGGTVMHGVVVQVDYTIVGPDGDTIRGSAYGEASDAGDKATPKAMSVALRTFLLQALCLPTDEPDPDLTVVERSTEETPEVKAQKVADGILVATDAERVRTVTMPWAQERDLLGVSVRDAGGNSLPLQRLFDKVLVTLGDTTAEDAAKKVIEESLGGKEITEPETTEKEQA